jgi:predicted amidohydrolase
VDREGLHRDPRTGRYFNCSYLINPSGDVVLKYRRINTVQTGSPHDFMDKYLDRYGIEGTFPVAKTDLGNLSMMPCGEIMYPEASRMFMLRGAEVLLHPTSDHGASDKWSWESAKKVRASQNIAHRRGSAGGLPQPRQERRRAAAVEVGRSSRAARAPCTARRSAGRRESRAGSRCRPRPAASQLP